MTRWLKNLGLVLTILFIASNTSAVIAAAPQPPIAITIVDSSPLKQHTEPELGTKQSQSIQLQSKALDQLATNLLSGGAEIPATFQVFDNLAYTAYFSKYETTLQGGYILSGNLDRQKDTAITLVNTDGIIAANLEDHGRQYHLEIDQAQNYRFIEIDQSQFPDEAPNMLPDMQSALAATAPSDTLPVADSASIVDVMVVYTDDARAAAGSTAAILNTINLAVVETNNGYANSGIAHRFNLVHTAELNFEEKNVPTTIRQNSTLISDKSASYKL